jgi:hypothetical protein
MVLPSGTTSTLGGSGIWSKLHNFVRLRIAVMTFSLIILFARVWSFEQGGVSNACREARRFDLLSLFWVGGFGP